MSKKGSVWPNRKPPVNSQSRQSLISQMSKVTHPVTLPKVSILEKR